MSSDSRKRQLRLAAEILDCKTTAEVACDRCFLGNIVCYIMPNSKLKCAECTRYGKTCVNMSWESLDRTREEYQKKVDEDESLLATVISRLLRNKKILAQAKERSRRKALCLASELEQEGEDVNAEMLDCPAASIGMGFSPTVWSTLDLIDTTVAQHGNAQVTGGSS